MTRTRILVTGATGFIGRRVVPRVQALGADIHILSRHGRHPVGWSGCTLHQIDLHDHASVDALVRQLKPERLLHLAWGVTPGVYVTSLDNLQWVRSTLHLVEAFVGNGGRRIVCAGTSAEYDWHFGRCSEADTPLRPASLYGACKHSLQAIVDRLAAQFGFSYAWGRVFFLYGPEELAERLIPSIIRAALDGSPLTLRHANQIRDYLHVDDVAAAFVSLLQSDVDGPVNIGSGRAVSLLEIGRTVESQVGRELHIETAESDTPDEYPVVVADVTRLQTEVGWRPRYSLEEGIADAIAWWAAQRTSSGT